MASKISLGLQRITRLLDVLDRPQGCYKIVHVAGTNGKGSVSAMIANTLSRAGFKTGLYTSPHLMYRWDGIAIDNRSISYADYAKTSRLVKEAASTAEASMLDEGCKDEYQVSTFEQMTAVAFQTFKDERIDIAVVEVGLGGKEDATNVVEPILSVITPIGIDHTAHLGPTIQSIAEAKAGIVKKGVPVVASSDQEYGEVFGVLGRIQRDVNPTVKVQWTPPNSTLDFRISNRNTARMALVKLREILAAQVDNVQERLSDEKIEGGLQSTQWRGRCELVDLTSMGGPESALIDGAHNQQSIQALSSVLETISDRSRFFVFGMTSGKDVSALQKLLRAGDRFATVEFEPVDEMEWIESASSVDLFEKLSKTPVSDVVGQHYGRDVQGAIRDAHRNFPGSDLIICGSLYLVGQVYRLLESAKYEQSYVQQLSTDSGTVGLYDAVQVEERVQKYWQGMPPVNPAAQSREVPAMRFLLPPPNVTGTLHIGHALTVAIEDAYCRFYRSAGHPVFWIPGTDHAGIATQSVVSKSLAKLGVQSEDLSRAEFVKEIWNWKTRFGASIMSQMTRLGTTLDWSAEYFTLDKGRSDAVQEAFRKLWDAGLIKREKRMVNWSVELHSVISDIEVDQKSIEGPTLIEGVEFGKMWRIRYYLCDQDSQNVSDNLFLEVDTTRPETVFGDRALAVHPDDTRYFHLVGRKVQHPLLPNVLLEIIADSAVRPDFGTGCVKITPAHDITDYEISQRHPNIPIVPVFGLDGKMLKDKEFANLAGLDRLSARKTVLDLLSARQALMSSSPHATTLNICSRTGRMIEPFLMPQWYITMAPLATEVLKLDDIKMSPKTRKEWNRWLTDIKDWCISRQLVWGHRIPLYRVVDDPSPEGQWFYGRSEQEAEKNAGGRKVVQDTDVLDTWFSSGLLPLSAFGWPSKDWTPGPKLDFIESGPDIIFFWLARMAMLCTFLTQTTPFKEIVLHPLIRDSQGRKMSKSLGNVIDPLSLIEGQSLLSMIRALEIGNLKESELKRAAIEMRQTYPAGIQPFGADALRYALIHSTAQSEALKFDIRSVQNARYLASKLWNAVNFLRHNLRQVSFSAGNNEAHPGKVHDLADLSIMSHFNDTLQIYKTGFRERNLSSSTEALRKFFIDQFCDVHVEFVKAEIRTSQMRDGHLAKLGVFKMVLERVLKLFAPFMPHITEELWHVLGNETTIHGSALPEAFNSVSNYDGFDLTSRMQSMTEVLKALRALPSRKTSDVTLVIDNVSNSLVRSDLEHYKEALRSLSAVRSLTILAEGRPKTPDSFVCKGISMSVHADAQPASKGASDASAAETRALKKLQNLMATTTDPNYMARVPEDIKRKHREQLEELRGRVGHLL